MGVPCGVSWVGASLVLGGGLVGVGAVVGVWGWDWSLIPLPSIESEELWSVLDVHVSEVLKDILVVVLEGLILRDWLVELIVFMSTGWLILGKLDSGGSSDKGKNEFHLQK